MTDHTETVDFRSGKAFEQWGHPMAVFGLHAVELSVFPEGATVEP